MTEIVVATRDGVLKAPDGTLFRLYRGKTLADARHPAVVNSPESWTPMHVELPVEGAPEGGGAAPAAPERDAELDELRNDLAEAEELAEHRGMELQRLADGLRERGHEPAGEQRPGWVVDLALEVLTSPPPMAAPKPARTRPAAPQGTRK